MKTIVAFFLFAIPVAAQVSIGSGVSVGGIPNLSVDVLSLSKSPGNIVAAKNEYQTITNGSTQTLIDYSSGLASARPSAATAGRYYYATDTSTLYQDSGSVWNTICSSCAGGPGYLASMFSTGGQDGDTIKIYYDGNVSADISLTWQQFFGAYGSVNGTTYQNRYMSYIRTATTYSYQWRLPLPFASGIKITTTNNSGSSETFFSDILLETGVQDSWPNTRHFYEATFQQTACTLDSTATLANIASGIGRIAWIQWKISGTESNATEGNFTYYVNGNTNPSFVSSGSEDFFETGNNWFGAATPWVITGGTIGVYLGTIGGSGSPNPIGAFRYHIDDPWTFTNGFKITWGCGESSHGSSGNPDVWSTVGYYLQ